MCLNKIDKYKEKKIKYFRQINSFDAQLLTAQQLIEHAHSLSFTLSLQKQQQQQLVVGQRSSQLSRDRDRLRDRDQRAEDRPHNGAGSSRSIAQVSHKRERNAASGAASGGAGGAGGAAGAATATGDQHTALMDEFKRAHQRMFRNGFHESEHKVSWPK